MHTLVLLSSILLVVLGGYVVLGCLPGVDNWRQRRRLQVLVLAAPGATLGVGLAGLYHFDSRICFLTAPAWDHALGTATPLVMGIVALGATGLGALRLGLLSWAVVHRSVPAAPELQALADRLADRLGAPRPRVRVCASDQPLALSCGLRFPTLLVSTWMLRHLDAREFEAVLAHEVGHAARRDYLVVWLTTVLRDAFFYLPTSRVAYHQLQGEKELACDDLAAATTGRPLALASALAKTWGEALGPLMSRVAPAFAGYERPIEERIERLLQRAQLEPALSVSGPACARSAGLGASALVSLVMLQVAGITIMLLNPMACGPASPLWRVL